MEKTMIQTLIEEAMEARKKSYCPFSGFAVGAALLAPDGTIFRGCNVEVSGLGATCCAERTAIFKAVSEGYREFSAVAIVGGKKDGEILFPCAPCGICRQVLVEFGDLKAFQVILAENTQRYEVYSLEELLPLAFRRDDC
ncbi:MAG: cytidine deaminase [Angelakisella sp.]